MTPRRAPVRGRPEAADLVWPWREAAAAEAKEAKRLRGAGVVRAVLGSVVGSGLYYTGHVNVAVVAWALSFAVLALAILSPTGTYLRLDRLVLQAGRLVGVVLSWLLLTPVFVLFFIPFGLLLRRGSRDTLARKVDPDAESYWTEARKGGSDTGRPF